MRYKKALFIFRRDLRLDDNTGLMHALQLSEQVIPCFIVDPRQVGADNIYRSSHAQQFMAESLHDLEKQLKAINGRLYFFYGVAEQIVKKIIKQENIDALFCNRDYTPFSTARDEAIAQACTHAGIDFNTYDDALLNEPDTIKTGKGEPYTVFTPFYKRCMKEFVIAQPQHIKAHAWYTHALQDAQSSSIYTKIAPHASKTLYAHGGSAQATNIIKHLDAYKAYAHEHDFPALDKTTGLSAHLKFGTVSIRRTYHAMANALGKGHPLIRQLYWRDFFTHIAYHFPTVFGHSFRTQYDAMPWSTNKKMFDAWCTGNTGFPIVDAGMRQLNSTGFMHNRVRLITGSFLTKDLHIDWRWGERYFAQQLTDYDPAVNNGNWQWIASTGCDAQPYFRIFNPWLQQKKFDPDCAYIKRWVPELANVPNNIIHTWHKQKEGSHGYPLPIVDHTLQSRKAKDMYKKTRYKGGT